MQFDNLYRAAGFFKQHIPNIKYPKNTEEVKLSSVFFVSTELKQITELEF